MIEIRKEDKLFKHLVTGTFYDHVHPKVGMWGRRNVYSFFQLVFHNHVLERECVCVCVCSVGWMGGGEWT